VPALAVLTVVVILSIARGLASMVRRPPEPDDEIEIPQSAEPKLHDRVRAIADVVGTRPPDRIVATADVNAYVREFGPLMGLIRGTRTLAIGMPLVEVLTVAQLEAVLAHELGHLAGGDTRLGPLAYRTDQAAQRMIVSLRGRALASVFVAYWRFMHKVSAGVRRGQELIADRAAVRVAGRQAAADALHRVEITGRTEALYREAYLLPLLQSECRPRDLAGGLRQLLRDPRRVEELRSDPAFEEQAVDPWASHPPTDQRIARVAELADAVAAAADDRPARVLWHDPERWAQLAHERWLDLVTGGRSDFRVVEWEAFGLETAGRTQRESAADVDGALGRMGLAPGVDGLKAAIASGRGGALAGELIAGGWRIPGPDERTAVLTAAVSAVLVRDVLDRGVGQLEFSWSEPLTLRDANGARIPVGDVARRAVAGDWDAITRTLTSDRQEGRLGVVTTAPRNRGGGAASGRRAAVPDRPALPEPPCPPFSRREQGGWEVDLPGNVGTSTKVLLGPDGLAFGKAAGRYDEISGVSIKLDSSSGVRGNVKVRLASGAALKLSAAAVGGKKGSAIEATLTYLWVLFSSNVGPRLRADIVSQIEAGHDVKVGNLTLSTAGITFRVARTQQVPWDQVVDAGLEAGTVHIHRAKGTAITTPLGAENAFLLVDLVPELRARYG
jgi:Zn-dependent protease with chaperone function